MCIRDSQHRFAPLLRKKFTKSGAEHGSFSSAEGACNDAVRHQAEPGRASRCIACDTELSGTSHATNGGTHPDTVRALRACTVMAGCRHDTRREAATTGVPLGCRAFPIVRFAGVRS